MASPSVFFSLQNTHQPKIMHKGVDELTAGANDCFLQSEMSKMSLYEIVMIFSQLMSHSCAIKFLGQKNDADRILMLFVTDHSLRFRCRHKTDLTPPRTALTRRKPFSHSVSICLHFGLLRVWYLFIILGSGNTVTMTCADCSWKCARANEKNGKISRWFFIFALPMQFECPDYLVHD